jgi:hypothetical protein
MTIPSNSNRLLNNVNVDTTSNGYVCDGGVKGISIWGSNFGGGSIAIEVSPDAGTTWINVPYNGSPSAFTANANVGIYPLCHGWLLRAVFSGSTNPVNVNADIYQV